MFPFPEREKSNFTTCRSTHLSFNKQKVDFFGFFSYQVTYIAVIIHLVTQPNFNGKLAKKPCWSTRRGGKGLPVREGQNVQNSVHMVYEWPHMM